LINMRILHLNEDLDLTRGLSALESERTSDSETFPGPESESLDHIAPDWQLRLHDGVVIDHILEVINRPRKSSRSRSHYRAPSDVGNCRDPNTSRGVS
jgi:hypothetical protein